MSTYTNLTYNISGYVPNTSLTFSSTTLTPGGGISNSVVTGKLPTNTSPGTIVASPTFESLDNQGVGVQSITFNINSSDDINNNLIIYDTTTGLYQNYALFGLQPNSGINVVISITGLDTSSPSINITNTTGSATTFIAPTTSLPESFAIVYSNGSTDDFQILLATNNCLSDDTLVEKMVEA